MRKLCEIILVHTGRDIVCQNGIQSKNCILNYPQETTNVDRCYTYFPPMDISCIIWKRIKKSLRKQTDSDGVDCRGNRWLWIAESICSVYRLTRATLAVMCFFFLPWNCASSGAVQRTSTLFPLFFWLISNLISCGEFGPVAAEMPSWPVRADRLQLNEKV